MSHYGYGQLDLIYDSGQSIGNVGFAALALTSYKFWKNTSYVENCAESIFLMVEEGTLDAFFVLDIL